MSQHWEMKGNILVNNALKQKDIFYMTYEIWGKKYWRPKNVTAT